MSALTTTSQWQFPTCKLVSIYLQFISRIVIICAAICFVATIIGYNPAKYISTYVMNYNIIAVLLYLIICTSIIFTMTDRNFYLPFLSNAVYPCGSLAEKIPNNANLKVNIKVQPNVNVIYWASESSDPKMQSISNPWDAYANYDNAGVVRSDANGNAVLSVRSPSSYRVGLMNVELDRHIHYRVCMHPSMLSDIKTVKV